MKISVLLIMIISNVCTAFAQTNADDIQVKKGIGTVKLYQYGSSLKPKRVLKIMKPNANAYNEFRKAKNKYHAARAMEFIGAFMIILPLGSEAAQGTGLEGDTKWGIAVGGIGLVLLSIPLNIAYNKHARNAAEIFNNRDRGYEKK